MKLGEWIHKAATSSTLIDLVSFAVMLAGELFRAAISLSQTRFVSNGATGDWRFKILRRSFSRRTAGSDIRALLV